MTPRELAALIQAGTDIADIGARLDAADPFSRRRAVTSLGSSAQAALYRLAEQAPPLSLTDFVPAKVGRQTPVAHHGYNTLPMPGLRGFTKWMARNGAGEIFGYNDSPVGPLIGPGYFVLRETEGDETARGAVVVDYYLLPEGGVPSGWPPLRANWVGLQVLVYHQTRDYMRRVSRHVTIGAAYKWNLPVGSYFVLCREDPGG